MRYSILSLLCGATVIAYVQRSAISVPAGMIQRDFAVDATSIGLVMSAWYWGYAAFQIPSGWLADRWGSRPVLMSSALAWSALTGLTGLARNFVELLILWTLMGVAQAGIFPCSTKTIGIWFGDTRRAFASGLLMCAMAVGAAMAPLLTAYLLKWWTWQQVFMVYAIPGLIWAALLFKFMAEPPASSLATAQGDFDEIGWYELLVSVPMALLCTQQFLRAAAMVFFSTWFPRFLQEAHGVSQFESGQLTAWPCGAVIVGALVGGCASDWIFRCTGNRWLSRQGIAIAGMIACCLFCVGAYVARQAESVVGLMSAGAFWASFGGVSGYPAAIEYGGSRVATVFSTMNMCGNIGAGVFPVTVAWLVERYHDWNLALLVFAGIFAADALCWALFNPHAALKKSCLTKLPELQELAV